MTHPRVLILGRSAAEMLLRSPESRQVEAIISIHGRHEPPLTLSPPAHVLVLQFDDAEPLDLSKPLDALQSLIRQRQAAEDGRLIAVPTIEDAQAIIDFSRRIADIRGALLCQCQGGISRSSAAALLAIATWTGQGQEQYCMQQVLQIRPSAAPLLGLVTLGDNILNRGGKLVQAVLEARRSA